MKKLIVLFFLFFFFTNQGLTQSLDDGFGIDGVTIENLSGFDDRLNSIALQTGNQVIAVGSSTVNNKSNYIVARFTEGILDKSFGIDGKVIDKFGDSINVLTSIAIQPDKKILAGGYTHNGKDNDMVIVRYNSTGQLDKTFGENGKLVIDFGLGDQQIKALALAPNGNIIIAGFSGLFPNYHFALARLTNNGDLDSSFGTNGKTVFQISDSLDWANCVILEADGKIILGGGSYINLNSSSAALVRFNENGSLDKNFGTNGLTVFDIGIHNEIVSSVLQKDGKILVGVESQLVHTFDTSGNDTWMDDITMARFHPNGRIDSTFDSDGKLVVYNYITASGNTKSILLKSNGEIFAGGADYKGFRLLRVDENGVMDKNFGNNGIFIINLKFTNLTGMIMQADGRIIVFGSGGNNSKWNFVMTRYIISNQLKNESANKGVSTILVYPNPVRNFMSFNLNLQQYDNVQIEISDANGAIISENNIIDSTSVIDMSSMANGFYFYKLYSNKNYIKSGKIVVSH